MEPVSAIPGTWSVARGHISADISAEFQLNFNVKYILAEFIS